MAGGHRGFFLRLYLALPIRRESSPAQLDTNSGVANCRRPSWFFEARVKKYQFFSWAAGASAVAAT